MRDTMRDHHMRSKIRSRRRVGWQRWLYDMFYATQSWILISMIGYMPDRQLTNVSGVSVGLLAGWIDVISAWLGDIRFGFCEMEWYGLINRDVQFLAGSCQDWADWSFALFGHRGVFLVNWIFYVAFSVLFASVCAYLVIHLAPYAAGSGTAEVKTILGGFIIKKFLGIKTLLVKAVGLPLMVASGLAVGKEGPMVHLACCVANVFPRLFSKYWRNEAASGAGIAVAFGAPIGGVLFSLEELSSFFPTKTMVRSFFCALVATVTLQLVDPYRGKRVLYQVSYSRPWHFFEILFFLILGIFGGLSGALFVKASEQMLKFRKSSRLAAAPLREAILIALATAILCYFNDFTRVDSSDLLEALFRECEEADFHGLCSTSQRGRVVASLFIALIMRLVLTIVTFGIKVPAGIFIPSMVWGALFGRLLGILVQRWQTSDPDNPMFQACHPDSQCVTPGVYALLGAIGALGGVTRMTLSLTVVMFELTGTLNYIVPCMITLMTAKVIGDLCGKGGMAEMQIRTNQYPFLDPRVDEVVGLPASKVMTPVAELVCFVSAGMRLADVESALEQMNFKGFPVVNNFDDSFMLGYISREDLEYAIGKAMLFKFTSFY
ncbi:chloride channel [Gaertneriomyces semiglobifer]|nr:chloride channel [Gaertneriomyces semiglobifer]